MLPRLANINAPPEQSCNINPLNSLANINAPLNSLANINAPLNSLEY